MVLYNLFVITIALMVLAGCTAPQPAHPPVQAGNPIEYKNPLIDKYRADPFILPAEGAYYIFATGRAPDKRFIPIYKSTDMQTWEFVKGAVQRGKEGAWNRKNFWAPEVMFINGKYHLYYTASTEGTPKNTGNRVGLAIADHPEGPYKDVGPVIPHASLDGSPFLAEDGTLYMYYTTEHGSALGFKPGRIYVEKMLNPREVDGNPQLLLEKYHWQEGPCVLKRYGKYYMTFSTGGWKSENYCVRLALADSPLGPFTELPGKIIEKNDLVKGPGHHSIFIDHNGGDWIVYHGWDPDFKARYPRIDPLLIRPEGMATPGPTSTPQKVTHEFWSQELEDLKNTD